MRGWMKKARENSGMTMKEVAEKLNITEAYYSLIESGERQKKLDITIAAKMSDTFGVPIEEIVKNEAAS